jgi:hypothetical protein
MRTFPFVLDVLTPKKGFRVDYPIGQIPGILYKVQRCGIPYRFPDAGVVGGSKARPQH